MTDAQFKALFPNASRSFLSRNGRVPDPRPTAVVEPDPCHAALEPGEVQNQLDGRFRVRITSVRRRLLDEDNLCEKYVVDCCRYAGLIPGDASGQTKIEVFQRKCAKGEAEKIEVRIEMMPKV